MADHRVRTLMPYAFWEGQIVPIQDTYISLGANSLQYGTTCFGGMRAYYRDGKVRLFRLRDHYDRLMNSCKLLSFPFEIDYADFRQNLSELLICNAPQTDTYIRPFIYSPDEVLSPNINKLSFDLGIYVVPFDKYFNSEGGLRLGISSWRKVPDNVIPTKAKAGGCYLNSALATADAQRAGYDEALLTDSNGFIAEASAANIILVHRDRVFLPPIGSPLLEGITMRTVLTLLEDFGKPTQMGPIDRSMIYGCDELILTGTAAELQFVHSVDGRVIGKGKPGALFESLNRAYRDILEKRHPRHQEWIEEVELPTRRPAV